jgi:ATP-dependent RNA helicase DDX3X
MAPGFNIQREGVKAEPLVVIVVPTHELAVQVFDECRRLCYRTMLRPFATYGGQPMGVMYHELAKGCDILVATTGRLVDLMGRPDVLTMSRVRYTVIDEADEMLSPDWEEHMKTIMAGGDTNDDADHLYLMFSATFPKELRALARQYMAPEHYRLTVGRAGSSHKNIAQDVIFVGGNKKLEACFDLLYSSEPVRTLIFCNTKRTVDELDAYLYQRHLPSTSIHSDRGQREREDSMRAFRSGRAPILIATGVTARGLDVAGIEHVINYDLPSSMFGGIHEYVHRIGRTARIGNTGKATSFYDERRDEEIGPALVKTMLEASCTVPEFLAHFVPEDGVVTFEDDESDEEGEGEPEADADAGGAAVDGADAGFVASAWGAPAPDADAGAGFAAVPDNAWGAAAAAAPTPEASAW